MFFKRLKISMSLLVVLITAAPTLATAEIIWHWHSHFDAAEQRKLKSWITTTVTAVETAVAPYPFDVHIYFHRLAGRGEPTPWANTNRSNQQAVHFHVDPSFSKKAFLQDWTAPHELSHLLIPYVGRNYSWFAEGFASFMQYQIMAELGVMKKHQVQGAYKSKVTQAQRQYFYHELPFHNAAQRLRHTQQHPVYYWGGAVYFMKLNQRLIAIDSSLIEVLARYVRCCRARGQGLSDLIYDLDALSQGDLFLDELIKFESEIGFPEHNFR